ncbi:hypothetical protein M514_15554 [Trichuris suis]|uniref:Uncharacterized protein n=1 Tax=Trichuris suis TaxID=68888 RepID=A0A085NS35_9BILA|nr:hypothetical protein M514_15554 [Trichuris suis]
MHKQYQIVLCKKENHYHPKSAPLKFSVPVERFLFMEMFNNPSMLHVGLPTVAKRCNAKEQPFLREEAERWSVTIKGVPKANEKHVPLNCRRGIDEADEDFWTPRITTM